MATLSIARQDADEGKRRSRNYLPQLDGIRALAVFGVIVQHFWIRAELFRPGLIGVYVFFVLSGFLITRILLDCVIHVQQGDATRGHVLRQFYIRRFLRIFPLYYLFLIMAAAINVGGIRAIWPWFAGYVSNVYFVRHGWLWPLSHFWTLAVEEQFYLIWPWVVLWSSRRTLRNICVAAIVLGTSSKLLIYTATANTLAGIVLLPDCVDTLACGALLAVILSDPESLLVTQRWMRAVPWPGLALIAVGVAAAARSSAEPLVLTFISAGVCLIGSWLVVRSFGSDKNLFAHLLLWPPLRYVGTISYGIYVWHYALPVVIGIAQRRLHLPAITGLSAVVVVTALSIVVASASWWVFERPINELKRFFPYSPIPRSAPIRRRSKP